MTSITRSQGKLLLNGAPATLRGGAYNLFLTPRASEEAIVRDNTTDPILVRYPGVDPCQSGANKAIPAEYAFWAESATGNTFPEFFAAMRENRCNFVRVWMMGGTVANVTWHPFVAEWVNGRPKYDVRSAVLYGRWNEAYFTRLRAFVDAAAAAGVVVQLTPFNYYDLGADDDGPVKSWSLSPWRAANCRDAAWAGTHLIPDNDATGDPLSGPERHRWFITPPNALRAVQQELLGRTVKAVAGAGNVILELMNEPHFAEDIHKVAEFDSYFTGLIARYRGTLGAKALISINASYVLDANAEPTGPSDVDVWRTSGRPNYHHVDLVSYHGLTGFPSKRMTACGVGVKAPPVDSTSVMNRARQHFAAHPDKPLLYCTDAVLTGRFEHTYNGGALLMNVRDGQILVEPGVDPNLDPERAQRLHSRVVHWAARCAAQARERPGQVHFQNHSTYRQGLVQTGQAFSTFAVAGIAEPAAV